MQTSKSILILGANSDVARESAILWHAQGYQIYAASRDMEALNQFKIKGNLTRFYPLFFDAMDVDSHSAFYRDLPHKPNIVLYAAGFLVQNDECFWDFQSFQKMVCTNYIGAVSILSKICFDTYNTGLERVIGLSSLSGIRGRKSNFYYGSTKAAFSTFLEGLSQELSGRKIKVNTFVLGYIKTKINDGLRLNKSLMMEPQFVANIIVNTRKSGTLIPDMRWKLIYLLVRFLPKSILAKLP